jgi:hypothetical protein
MCLDAASAMSRTHARRVAALAKATASTFTGISPTSRLA